MRLALTAAYQAESQREVAAYKHMGSLQGIYVPRLIASGYSVTLNGTAL